MMTNGICHTGAMFLGPADLVLVLDAHQINHYYNGLDGRRTLARRVLEGWRFYCSGDNDMTDRDDRHSNSGDAEAVELRLSLYPLTKYYVAPTR